MNKNDELVLTATRQQLESHGAFQGYRHGTELLDSILETGHWQFRRRGDVEDDPSFKQLIPYCVIVQADRVLVYERGSSGGEDKLHTKLSLGIGGHINPQDAPDAPGPQGSDQSGQAKEQMRRLVLRGTAKPEAAKESTGSDQLHRALLRELSEEIGLPGQPSLRYTGLINDERDPVGQVHFGVVVVVEVPAGEISPLEDAIHNPKMVPVQELGGLADRLEGWSKIVVEHLGLILPKTQNP